MKYHAQMGENGRMLLKPPDPVITAEDLIRAQAAVDAIERKKINAAKYKADRESLQLTPAMIFNDDLTQIVYYIDTAIDRAMLDDRVISGMTIRMWTIPQWNNCIKQVVEIKGKELNLDVTGLITIVEEFATLSSDEQDEIFVSLLSKEEQKSLMPPYQSRSELGIRKLVNNNKF